MRPKSRTPSRQPREDDASSSDAGNDPDTFTDGQSSISTAGPPPDSPHHTGQYNRPPWTFASAHRDSSETSSLTGSCSVRGGGTPRVHGTWLSSYAHNSNNYVYNASNATGSIPASAMAGTHNSLERSATAVSPMGSSSAPREWGKSFRLFNTSRVFRQTPQLRPRDSAHSQRSTVLHGIVNTRGSFIGADGEHGIPPGNGSVANARQSSVFSACSGGGGGTYIGSPNGANRRHTHSPELRNMSMLFLTGSPLPVSINAPHNPASPLLASQRLSSFGGMTYPNLFASVVASASARAEHAMQESFSTAMSPFQKGLPMLFNALRSNLALNGQTIIVGDAQHPLEIKRGSLIGVGGYAKVYVGLNTVRGELVAIKEMSIADVEDIHALDTIEQEFNLLRSLRHPNIVHYHLFEHSKSQKVCRIVMELLAGDSTLKLLHKRGPLTEAILRKLTRHLLNALQFIHREGIFHRDVKPANILVSHRGEVKLCDFGCSKRVSELNKATSCIIGTPIYMAPELIKGEGSRKSDIWSMACSLFELATGLLPWYHSGVKDNLPLMFYITTTSESPLVFPVNDKLTEFSAEFINFLEVCFRRDLARRPEAAELLHHPWLVAGRTYALCSHPPSMHLSMRSESPPSLAASLTPSKQSQLATRRGDGSSAPRQDATTASLSTALVEDGGSGGNRGHTDFGANDAITDNDGTEDSDVTNNPCTASTSVPQLVDDEALCQLELEEVSAVIAADLCQGLLRTSDATLTTTVVSGGVGLGPLVRKSVHTTTELSGGEEVGSTHTQTFSVASQSLHHYGQGHPQRPPRASMSVGDFTSSSVSPEYSILHDNFRYGQAGLGASAGNFVLPTELPEAPPPQQFLRINEEGNLDFADLPDAAAIDDGDDREDDGGQVARTGAVHIKSGSMDSIGLNLPHGSRVFSSERVSPSLRESATTTATTSPHAPLFPSDRHSTPPQATTPALTPAAGSTVAEYYSVSHEESPYRGFTMSPVRSQSTQSMPRLPAAMHDSNTMSHTVPPETTPISLLSRAASKSSSLRGDLASREALSPSSISIAGNSGSHCRTTSFRHLVDKARSQGDGRLHMSFAVSTAPGAEVNVELNVNPDDVQCRMVNNEPTYLVALTDDVRGQITSKIKEVAMQSAVLSPGGASPLGHPTPRAPSPARLGEIRGLGADTSHDLQRQMGQNQVSTGSRSGRAELLAASQLSTVHNSFAHAVIPRQPSAHGLSPPSRHFVAHNALPIRLPLLNASTGGDTEETPVSLPFSPATSNNGTTTADSPHSMLTQQRAPAKS